jgi:putative cofactor-binding repeat protein
MQDKAMTGFANSEEAAVGLTEVVHFPRRGYAEKEWGKYSKGPDWQSHVVVTGNLITGQNPASPEAAAKALLARLGAA